MGNAGVSRCRHLEVKLSAVLPDVSYATGLMPFNTLYLND